jgi:hypothetical protein
MLPTGSACSTTGPAIAPAQAGRAGPPPRRPGAQQRQLEAAAAQRLELQAVADGIEAFCQAIRTGLATATFEQRRLLAELLIDRVIVTDGQVEIRYVLPTSPDGPHRPFASCVKTISIRHLADATAISLDTGTSPGVQHR